jgi:hypothetical protein
MKGLIADKSAIVDMIDMEVALGRLHKYYNKR